MIIFEKLFLFEEEIIRSICKFSTYLREVTVRHDSLITIVWFVNSHRFRKLYRGGDEA